MEIKNIQHSLKRSRSWPSLYNIPFEISNNLNFIEEFTSAMQVRVYKAVWK